jgi:hypothetical protein
MKKNKHILLLKKLEENGLERPFNVSKFMIKYFDKPTMIEPCLWSKEGDSSLLFLKNMLLLEYIVFDYEELKKSIHESKDVDDWDKMKWFDTVDFYINPTIKGFNYIHEYQFIESQRKYSFAALIISVAAIIATMIFGILDYFKDCL